MVKQTIQIFGRIKPTKKTTAVYSVDNEEQTGASLEFVVPRDLADGFVNNKRECYKFRFQKVFDRAVKQEEIFQNIAKPVADSVLAGYNGTIFAYGQTGSGKTFTITGGAERYSDRGIIPRTLSYLYECFSQDSSMVYTIHISYLEIYNEMGYDLLDSRNEASRLEDLPRVAIMEDSDQNIHLRNLSLQQSANEEEALNLLFLGDTNRMIAETPMNQASTRSHCVFTVHVCRREPGSATVRRSKLHLVDLAGSDRVSKTGLNGQLLTEAKYINLSLHYLEQVIIALSEKNRSHIPYRNSVLTSVLRDSLGGNCMTTMIATMAVDKRNLDESISTCRFAQRVALIKNEAILNEELDPALLIARLKREIESLKEELAMVTGEQRDDQLTVEEIHTLKELVKAFLDDPDPDETLLLGPDMRKIQFCFSLLKIMIVDKQGGGRERGDGKESPAATVSEEVIQDDYHSAKQVTTLKEMLSQRDNEISILVKMLKTEKKRVQDAAAQLANVTSGQSLASQNAPRSSTMPVLREGSTDTISASHGGRAMQFMKRGPQLSMGKQEAFETFIRDHEDYLTIEDNKSLLKQRSAEARRLGEQMNGARNGINELKKQLEMRRRQRAARGVMGNCTGAEEEVDTVEENLCKQIEQEKKVYKSTVGRLKALRTEIEHLQLLLERAKVKFQKDFHKWWSQEASSDQESESGATARSHLTGSPGGTLQPSSPGTPGFGAPGLSSSLRDYPAGRDQNPNGFTSSVPELRSCSLKSVPHVTAVPARHDTSLDRRGADNAPPSEWRALSTTKLTSSSIPLTGDQRTDADILAFVRARQNLLNRTGYGNLSPSTVSGQVFCVFYALCGIPLNLAFLKQLGKCLTIRLGRLKKGMVSVVPHKQTVEALALSLFFISGSLLFLVIPPLLFSYVEGWTFGEGFYFAFITLSTIGFGDYVVGTDPGKEYISLYRSLAGIWIIFALAWLALILNMGSRVMQHVVVLTHPGFKQQEEEEDVSSCKLEDTSKI
ncbi:putative kinesin-like protein KIF6 [Scophthalmus maximus]|uniref:Putative kinesin-like protein KIF6 n=1 Tax=Scophthalmus maximus TaxID=52904 RepID=A0A2U9CMJ1_SCOMX|nr:putative kinesin-like protein KIF6 [Scophthalmus maximus]